MLVIPHFLKPPDSTATALVAALLPAELPLLGADH